MDLKLRFVDRKYVLEDLNDYNHVLIFGSLPDLFNQLAAIDVAGKWVPRVKDTDFTIDPPHMPG